MNEFVEWHNDTIVKKTIDSLKKNGFNAQYFETADRAAEYVLSLVHAGDSVGFGGSMTVKGMGIAERVKAIGGTVLDHSAPGLSPDEKMSVMRAQLTSDVFIAGANALTVDGFILNVDGNGNRVAALTFGPKITIIIAGINKITSCLEEAYRRVEVFAAPVNMKRIGRKTPCTETGMCADCCSPERGCRIYAVMKRKPSSSDYRVIIVGECLGF